MVSIARDNRVAQGRVGAYVPTLLGLEFAAVPSQNSTELILQSKTPGPGTPCRVGRHRAPQHAPLAGPRLRARSTPHSIHGRNASGCAGPCPNQARVPLNAKRRPAPFRGSYMPSPAIACSITCCSSRPCGTRSRSVSGKNAVGWYLPASGSPMPVYGVPPWHLAREPVEGGPISERLCGEAVVGIDVRDAVDEAGNEP